MTNQDALSNLFPNAVVLSGLDCVADGLAVIVLPGTAYIPGSPGGPSQSLGNPAYVRCAPGGTAHVDWNGEQFQLSGDDTPDTGYARLAQVVTDDTSVSALTDERTTTASSPHIGGGLPSGVTGDEQTPGGLIAEGNVLAQTLAVGAASLPSITVGDATSSIVQPAYSSNHPTTDNPGGRYYVAQKFNSGPGITLDHLVAWIKADPSVDPADYGLISLYPTIITDQGNDPNIPSSSSVGGTGNQGSNYSLGQPGMSTDAFIETAFSFGTDPPILAADTDYWVLWEIDGSSTNYPNAVVFESSSTTVPTYTSIDNTSSEQEAPTGRIHSRLAPPPTNQSIMLRDDATGLIFGGSQAEGEETTAPGANAHAEGKRNAASGDASHAEGFVTTASGPQAHAEGLLTTASGPSSSARGDSNSVSGDASTVDGHNNVVSGDRASAMGHRTLASLTGEYAHGSGYDPNFGDQRGNAQYSRLVGHSETTDATPVQITLDQGLGAFPIVVDDGQTWQVLAQVSATRHDTPGTSATFLIKGAVAAASGAARLIGTPTVESWADADASTWAATLAVSGANLELLVTGEADNTIYWFGTLHLARIAA